MGFLNPLFLLAGLAVAVPIVLHLFHRHDTRRVTFPAIRYLLRTEKDHARNIRFRQLLLLVLRSAAVLLVALVAARPFLPGGGGVHPPTALVIVLDNSMSSGRIVDDARALDRFKRAASESLEQAGEEDRVWLLRAAEPWAPAIGGSLEVLRAEVEATEVSAAAAPMVPVLTRARELVTQSGMDRGEVHWIGDLQASALERGAGTALGDVPLVVYGAHAIGGSNAWLDSLSVGGGLAPLANEASQVTVRVGGTDAGMEPPLRLVVDGRIRGAVTGRIDTRAVLPFGPFATGWVAGYVESDPDVLAADDRRYFALAVRPAPVVEVFGGPSFFVDNAVSVLEEAGRIRSGGTGDVRLALGGRGLDASGVPSVVVPEGDPTTLPALNRRLAAAGLPWRYEMAATGGEATVVAGERLPIPLGDVRVQRHFRLRPTDPADTAGVLARLSSGEPWIVDVDGEVGRALLVASPFDDEATSLPVTAGMIPLLDWTLGSWSAASGTPVATIAGRSFSLPEGARTVVDPQGGSHPVEGVRFAETRWSGIYDVLGDDGLLARVAVNPEGAESETEALGSDDLSDLGAGEVRVVLDSERWARRIFVDSQGTEVSGLLVWILAALLVSETLVAAAGRLDGARANPGGARDRGVAEA